MSRIRHKIDNKCNIIYLPKGITSNIKYFGGIRASGEWPKGLQGGGCSPQDDAAHWLTYHFGSWTASCWNNRCFHLPRQVFFFFFDSYCLYQNLMKWNNSSQTLATPRPQVHASQFPKYPYEWSKNASSSDLQLPWASEPKKVVVSQTNRKSLLIFLPLKMDQKKLPVQSSEFLHAPKPDFQELHWHVVRDCTWLKSKKNKWLAFKIILFIVML